MSECTVNEPRRHRERWNLNAVECHRALWNLSQRRDGDAGFNADERPAHEPAQAAPHGWAATHGWSA